MPKLAGRYSPLGMTTNLTPTSYAILGLLAIKPWTTYELATQIERTVKRFWPRTRSKLYEEPKKLVAAGLAEAAKGAHGRRPRTVYSITPAGRTALAAWLADRSAEPTFESEHLLKVFYAGSGTTDDVRATLADLRAWVNERTEHNVRVAGSYVQGTGPFPERLPILVLTGRFLDDYLEMIDRWAAWATEIVETWPESPNQAEPAAEEMAATLRQATARAERWRAAQPANATESAERKASA
jgi:PadR family transcriptional regulator, regulatory protein AphA